jgi:hypothetical protein
LIRTNSSTCSRSRGAERTPWRNGPVATSKNARCAARRAHRATVLPGARRLAGRVGRTADRASGGASRPAHRALPNVRESPSRRTTLRGAGPAAAAGRAARWIAGANPPAAGADPDLQRASSGPADSSRHRLAARCRSPLLAGLQGASAFLGASRIRANRGSVTAVAAVTVWIVAAMSATLITVTSRHDAHALAAQTHLKTAVASHPAASAMAAATARPTSSPSPKRRHRSVSYVVAPPAVAVADVAAVGRVVDRSLPGPGGSRLPMPPSPGLQCRPASSAGHRPQGPGARPRRPDWESPGVPCGCF